MKPKMALTNPRELTPEGYRRLKELLEMNGSTFEDAVFLWATDEGPEEDDKVLRHPHIAQRTQEALKVLIRSAEAERAELAMQPRTPEVAQQMRVLYSDQRNLKLAREEIGPYVHAAQTLANRKEEEQRALDVLRKLHFVEYKAILKDINAGDSAQTALRKARERSGS
jgi:hypothetical protein